MSDYQARFDALLAEANSAVSNHTTAIRERIPGLYPNHVRRLLAHMSQMLGHVDKGSAQNPEYLAGSPTIYPERAIDIASRIKTSFENGVEQFLQDILPILVEVDSRLTRAVGVKAYAVNEIKNAQVRRIDQYLDWSGNVYKEIYQIRDSAKSASSETSEMLTELQSISESSKQAAERISSIKNQAEKLASGNASQSPLERAVRDARAKIEEIEKIAARSSINEEGSAKSSEKAELIARKSEEAFKALQETNQKADAILRNATQAGLAGAYKLERERLSKEQNRFALAFYGGVVGIIIYAAIFILPVFSKILEHDGGVQAKFSESALLLLVRLAILAPAVWALIFTNKRHTNLEILQMDYAAKAATALAYSGYREEVDDDEDLSSKLRDGLVVRFVEHPERLLNKNRIKETVGFNKDGLSYSSVVTPLVDKIKNPVDGSKAEGED